jgi:CHASE1-domain containing sensor protein
LEENLPQADGQRHEERKRGMRNWHVWPIVAAACLGLALAAAAWLAVSAWEERLAKAKFTALASDYATVLQTGLDGHLVKILAVRALYNASNAVDADEFAVFTKQITEGYEDTMRLIWSPRVTDDERDLFEREARASGLHDFAIRTWAPSDSMAVSPPRKEYFLFSTRRSHPSAPPHSART